MNSTEIPLVTEVGKSELSANAGSDVLPGIQILRGLCAMLVVLSHENGFLIFPEYFRAMPLPPLSEAAVFAVAAFFAVSGFIIAITALDRSLRPIFPRQEFARRRFIRIVPFLWLCIVGYNILSWLGTGRMEWGPAFRTLLVWPVGELKPNVTWSLRHELLFYLLFGLTFLRTTRSRWLILLWFLCPILLWQPVMALQQGALQDRPQVAELLRMALLGGDNGANLQIGGGFVVGLLWLRGSRWVRPGLIRGMLPMIALLGLAATLIVAWPMPHSLGRALLWSAISTAILWAGVVGTSGDTAMRRIGMILGNASYSIYLIHNPVMLILLAAAKLAHVRPEAQWALALFLAGSVAISAAVGIAAHYWLERPLIRRLMRASAGWAKPRLSYPA